jgi:hypothetical protein
VWLSELPAPVQSVIREFRTCEFSTFAKDGAPVAWPIVPFLLDSGLLLVTSSIGIAQKVLNVRRNPKVSLLFSNPTGSSVTDPPAVLVQGDANAPDNIETTTTGFEPQFRMIFRRQPAGERYSSNPISRYFFDWYYMRLLIYVTPRRVLWWNHSDFSRDPEQRLVSHG